MVQRLYREDAYLRRFDARVLRWEPGADGLVRAELDRTAFYPTGGGQPFDTGELAGHEVVDVRDEQGERVVHWLRAPSGAPAPAGDVEGRIDWARRFDHMQQHTGQHILSRAFVELAGAATTSFHLGERTCTIDLALPEAARDLMRAAEARANEVVFGDEVVMVKNLPADRAGKIASDLRLLRELALKPGDPIRLIQVGGFDETPCGGTHVARSGEVGAVAIRSWDRFKGGTRVTFLCGGRVVRTLAELAGVVDACVALSSAKPADLPEALGRLQDQLAEARRQSRQLGEALAQAEADARDASARVLGERRVLVEVLEGRPMEELQRLAQRYAAREGRAALLAATDPATGRTSLVFARAEAGWPATLLMGEILSAVCSRFGGKGGGGPALARGGGLPAEAARSALEEAFSVLGSRAAS